jgi:hypothetical protein
VGGKHSEVTALAAAIGAFHGGKVEWECQIWNWHEAPLFLHHIYRGGVRRPALTIAERHADTRTPRHAHAPRPPRPSLPETTYTTGTPTPPPPHTSPSQSPSCIGIHPR